MFEITTGEQLKTWRLSLGYTQLQAARQIGLSDGWYKRLELGHRHDDNRPTLVSRTVAMACLGLTLERRLAEQVATPGALAGAVHKAMGRSGWSADALAAQAGISLTQLEAVLRGLLDQVAVADVNRLLAVLGIEPLMASYHHCSAAVATLDP